MRLLFHHAATRPRQLPAPLQTALTGQQEVEAHRQIYHLKIVKDVEPENDLLALPEVGDVVEKRARLFGRRLHGKRGPWRSFALSQLQRQRSSALAVLQALVAEVHEQEVGSRAVDGDPVTSDDAHLVLAGGAEKLQRLVGAAA